MAVVPKVKEDKDQKAPLQPELPPVKIMFLGMSKALPTGEGDMPAHEIEELMSYWIHLGYKIVEGSVNWSEGPNFWQLAVMLVKYD